MKIDCDPRKSTSKKQKINKNVNKNGSDNKQFCQNLQFNVDVTENFISIYKISGMPPKVIFTVTIDTSFKVSCYIKTNLGSALA